MIQPTTTLRLSWIRLGAILAFSHTVMCAVMHTLLSAYEPDPNGFRLDDPTEIFWFLTLTTPPLAVAAMAPSRISFSAASIIHAASPLALIPTMRTPGGDLNFAVFVWWFYVPAIMIAMFVAEFRWRNRDDRRV